MEVLRTGVENRCWRAGWCLFDKSAFWLQHLRSGLVSFAERLCPLSVCLLVCLNVCQWARLQNNNWADYCETWWLDAVWFREEYLQFWCGGRSRILLLSLQCEISVSWSHRIIYGCCWKQPGTFRGIVHSGSKGLSHLPCLVRTFWLFSPDQNNRSLSTGPQSESESWDSLDFQTNWRKLRTYILQSESVCSFSLFRCDFFSYSKR